MIVKQLVCLSDDLVPIVGKTVSVGANVRKKIQVSSCAVVGWDQISMAQVSELMSRKFIMTTTEGNVIEQSRLLVSVLLLW